MTRRAWLADVESAHTRGRCRFYVGNPDRGTQRLCRRTGTRTLTVGNLLPEGPFCWQHGLVAQDRATAAAIGTDRRVRLEVIR